MALFAPSLGEAGDYFARHLAGWNLVPITLKFPITVFVVRELLGDEGGCSMWMAGDYCVIDRQGLLDDSTLAHEIGHTCNLWHSQSQDNLMYHTAPSGETVKGFQRNPAVVLSALVSPETMRVMFSIGNHALSQATPWRRMACLCARSSVG